MGSIEELRKSQEPRLAFAARARAMNPQRLGVLSASFNPLTMAHVRMLEVADAQFQFDEWLLVLALANVDKPISGFSIEQRVALMQAWAKERDSVSIALCSHGRFVEKAQAIRTVYGPPARLFFVVGYDTLVRVFDPKYYRNMPQELEQLFAQCEFIAFNRAEADVATVRSFLRGLQVQSFASKVHIVELEPFYAAISGTHVRTLIDRGDSVRGLVPDSVAERLDAATR